ncbi:MAG: hypothetical protein PHO70_08120 [Candidatus Omnitrophica bacterium]|nr:hypothetical protein [Candidatus Omnitrophota bacterium]
MLSQLTSFKKIIFISIAGHLVFFTFFSFSFSSRVPITNYAPVSFLGQLLTYPQVSQIINKDLKLFNSTRVIKVNDSHINKVSTETKASDYQRPQALFDFCSKPQVSSIFVSEKESYTDSFKDLRLPVLTRKEQKLVFHPVLPYSFSLYFKDRQTAHVELAFKISAQGSRELALVKRKISSGNLEVDLLSLRYIGHYLFIQKSKFSPNNWQTVKIDLSAKND